MVGMNKRKGAEGGHRAQVRAGQGHERLRAGSPQDRSGKLGRACEAGALRHPYVNA